MPETVGTQLRTQAESPLPPHITFKQAEDYTKSFQGSIRRAPGVVNAMREKVDEFLLQSPR